MSFQSKVIAVVFGGASPEHDVSILTGLQAARALCGAGVTVTAIYWSKTGAWWQVDPQSEAGSFVDGVPKGAEELQLHLGDGGGFGSVGRLGRSKRVGVDVVVNCCHGGPGEDGSLQGAFDLAGIAYTGPSVAGAALGIDKLAFAGLVRSVGLSGLPRVHLGPYTTYVGFEGPYIVKPRFGGSSIGIEVVAKVSDAVAIAASSPHLRPGAVIEPYRADLFDLNVGVRTYPALELSAIEKPLRSRGGAEILGYLDKYVGGEGMASAPRELPAQISAELAQQIRACVSGLADICGVRGLARLDFLTDGTNLYVNEINTIPGSLGRYLWVDPPVPFESLVMDMVDEAIARPRVKAGTVGADGLVLKSASSIASKLA